MKPACLLSLALVAVGLSGVPARASEEAAETTYQQMKQALLSSPQIRLGYKVTAKSDEGGLTFQGRLLSEAPNKIRWESEMSDTATQNSWKSVLVSDGVTLASFKAKDAEKLKPTGTPRAAKTDQRQKMLEVLASIGVAGFEFVQTGPGAPTHFGSLESAVIDGIPCDVISYEEYAPKTSSNPYRFTLWISHSSHLPVKRVCDGSKVDFYYKGGELLPAKPDPNSAFEHLKPTTVNESYTDLSGSVELNEGDFESKPDASRFPRPGFPRVRRGIATLSA